MPYPHSGQILRQRSRDIALPRQLAHWRGPASHRTAELSGARSQLSSIATNDNGRAFYLNRLHIRDNILDVDVSRVVTDGPGDYVGHIFVIGNHLKVLQFVLETEELMSGVDHLIGEPDSDKSLL